MASLFGDLFEEEGEAAGSDSMTGPSNVSRIGEIPRPSRLSNGLCGIYNQGATCYLSSLLQTLLLTPEFREELFKLTSKELGNLGDKDKPGSRVRVIPIQLQRLFGRLLLLDQQGASTEELTDSFGWKDNEEFQQHDVQELNRILFSALEDSLVGTPGEDLVQKHFHGKIVNQIICQECNRISEREEDFLDICVAVSGNSSLEEGLCSSYVQTELMSGKNKYYCENCRKLVDASKGAKLRRLPPVLTFSLLRFGFDFVKMERVKEIGKFTYPMEIDMTSFCEDWNVAENAEYELFSVVIHSGSGYGGHYHANIRDVDNLGTWTHPDEEEILLPTDPATGTVDYIEYDSPIELVQALLVQFGKDGAPVDKLCAEMNKQTGVSWNKRFKKNYGPINKFLKKYDDKFVFNQTSNWVSLKDYRSEPTLLSLTSQHSASDSGQPEASKTNTKTAKRPRSPNPEPGHCWFNFDDSRVHPIRTKEMEKYFSGKQSAYMLFYRCKSMRRCSDACGNPFYGLPPELIEEVQAENARIKEKREEYELKINTIDLIVHFASSFEFKHGALQRVDPENCLFINLQLDRRKTVVDLKIAIMEHGAELVPEGFVIHRAKDLPAGLHLFEEISGDDMTVIMNTSVGHQSTLFVWDGKTINGEIIPTGEAFEPVLLTVTYGNPSKLDCGFPYNLTIGELRLILAEKTGIPAHQMSLSRMLTKGEDVSVIKLGPDQDGASLRDLKVTNGENIIAENKSSCGLSDQFVKSAVSSQRGIISFIVENRCMTNQDGSYPMSAIEIQKDVTVGELKATILSQLCIFNVEDGGRLRINDDNFGLRSPLHEEQTLVAANLSQGMHVVVEPGKAPETHELNLRFIAGNPDGKKPELEVIIDERATVQECLRLMLAVAEIHSDDWHLRRTNWCGEPAAVLDNFEATLEEYQIKDGELLLLEEGQLPPKGFLKLYLSLLPSECADTPSGDGSILSSITMGVKALLGSSSQIGESGDSGKPVQASPVSLGEVIISKEDTLATLKLQIMSLLEDKFPEKLVPAVEFLRVRLVENGRISTILRGHSQALQRQKLSSNSHLGVQVLVKEENLSTNHIVLDVCQRIADSRSYLPSEELVWDTSIRGAVPVSLRHAVANLIGQPAENLLLAKHFPEKYEWLVIKETTPSKNTKHTKGKKKGGPKPANLRQAPYHLKDGDVIGVKNLQFIPLNREDFSTEADDKGLEELRKKAEEKKQMRQDNRRRNAVFDTGAAGGDSKRRPEVGIKIHVGDFRS